MRNLILVLSLLVIVSSCDIMKKSQKTKSETGFKEDLETRIKRAGDTVNYIVPNVIYRDTTIFVRNTQGTTLKMVYDQSGRLTDNQCIASTIDEFTRMQREYFQQLKEKEKEKEEKANFDWLLYIIGGVVVLFSFLGGIGLFLMFRTVNKQGAVLATIMDKINK